MLIRYDKTEAEIVAIHIDRENYTPNELLSNPYILNEIKQPC
jgi:hypothetical protein